jgi:hypothetical protein
MKINLVVVSASSILLGVPSSMAHHSFVADFDTKRPVHLEGVVTKLEMVNPHVEIHVNVKGLDGRVISWMVEAGSPNVLLRRGFTKTLVQEGTKVLVEGYQSKAGSHRATGTDLILPNGKRLILGSFGFGIP